MDCVIDRLRVEREEAWIVGIHCERVQALIVLLVAYDFNKLTQITFQDCERNLSMQLGWVTAKGRKQRAVVLGGRWIPVDKTWLDAIIAMLLEVSLSGWSPTAHMDYDVSTAGGEITICMEVLPPA